MAGQSRSASWPRLEAALDLIWGMVGGLEGRAGNELAERPGGWCVAPRHEHLAETLSHLQHEEEENPGLSLEVLVHAESGDAT